MKLVNHLWNRRVIALMFIPIFVAFVWSVPVMAKDADTSPVGSFSLSWSGSMEYQYGSKSTSFDGRDKFRYETGDTLNSDSETGVGVFEITIQKSELVDMNAAAMILCGKEVREARLGSSGSQGGFRVVCEKNGKSIEISGSQGGIPEKQRAELYGIINRYENQARLHGNKVAKLDFKTEKIEFKDDGFMVSVRFINSGDSNIKFKTPDQWSGVGGGDRLGVGSSIKIEKNGSRDDVGKGWAFNLSGQTLLNRNEFPDGIVNLRSHDSSIFIFKSYPKYKSVKGEYEFTGISFMEIQCECKSGPLSDKLFFSPIKTRITIDRDYPSTPKEREEWEARHRDALSSWPVKPGEAFPEDGLYRAVRVGTGSRSLQVQPFKAGDIATTDDMRLLAGSASGEYLNGRMQWVWEASPPQRGSQPFTFVEGTEQFCKPGAVCPRSGRWVVRSMTHDWKYNHDLTQIVTVQQGKSMPAIQSDPRHGEWEWIGV